MVVLDRKKLFYTASVRCDNCREVFMWIISYTYTDWENPLKSSVYIPGLDTEIWTRDLRNLTLIEAISQWI